MKHMVRFYRNHELLQETVVPRRKIAHALADKFFEYRRVVVRGCIRSVWFYATVSMIKPKLKGTMQ